MKLLTLLLLVPALAMAEGTVVDPTINSQIAIDCIAPNTTVGGEVLDILHHNFYVSTDLTNWSAAGTNTTACTQTYTITDVADGQYYYTSSVTDTDNQEGAKGADFGEYLALVIKRPVALIPAAPTNVRVTQR